MLNSPGRRRERRGTVRLELPGCAEAIPALENGPFISSQAAPDRLVATLRLPQECEDQNCSAFLSSAVGPSGQEDRGVRDGTVDTEGQSQVAWRPLPSLQSGWPGPWSRDEAVVGETSPWGEQSPLSPGYQEELWAPSYYEGTVLREQINKPKLGLSLVTCWQEHCNPRCPHYIQ